MFGIFDFLRASFIPYIPDDEKAEAEYTAFVDKHTCLDMIDKFHAISFKEHKEGDPETMETVRKRWRKYYE